MASQGEAIDHSNGDLPPSTTLQNLTQIVKFTGEDEQHSEELTCSNVVLVPSSSEQEKCSSMVHFKRQVDFSWEHRYYTGQLLAVHMTGRYLAYGLRVAGQNNGIVRVVNRATGVRGLIKGMQGSIQDLAFAHNDLQVLLAIVDERGNLSVHVIEEETTQATQPSQVVQSTQKDLTCREILRVVHDVLPDTGCNHRVIWVPFLPDETEDGEKEFGDNSKLLVLTLGTKAELWSVGAVISSYGAGPLKPEDVEEGLLVITEHTKPIVDATFSPEGSALATVSLDGSIKFFQVYMQQRQPPRCLHNWRPHDGKPLSSIFFLDNHKAHNPDTQFWKFVVTGAKNNTELKLWSCVNWTCLQTVQFSSTPNITSTGSRDELTTSNVLKAGLDLGARHLVLSDIFNQAIYVLRIHIDELESTAYMCSVSEFKIPFSILSFGVVAAGSRLFINNSFSMDADENDDPEEEDEDSVGVLMYLVQPKSMQRCMIQFTPPSIGSELSLSTIHPDNSDTEDATLSLDKNVSSFDMNSSNPYKSSISLNLMTPDEFSTSPHKPKETGDAATKENNTDANSDVFTSFPRDLVSGGSSPSREVQEILSTNNSGVSGVDVQDLVNLSPPQTSSFFDNPDIPKIDLDVSGGDSSVLKEKDVLKTSNGWLHIPLLPESLKPNEEITNKLMQRSPEDHFLGSTPNSGLKPKFMQRLEANVSTILATVQQQEAQITELRQEVARTRNSETMMANLFNQVLKDHSALLEEQMALRDSQERDRQEVLKSAVSQAVGNLVSAKLEDIVLNVVRTTIMPAIINDMEQLKSQLHREMTQKLSTTDHLLQENISKLVNSKSVMDALVLSLASTMTPSVTEICKEAFVHMFVPRCEKALEKIFIQVHETFTQGTREYFTQIQKEVEKFRLQMTRGTELMSDYETNTRDTRDKLLGAVQSAMHKGIKHMEDNISGQVTKAVKESITKELQSQKTLIEESVMTAVRSRAVTPASHVYEQIQMLQSHVMQLAGAGQYNAAFQQALSASDLNIVVYLCDKLNPEQLFRRPCPLQQPVLLSLIQQLSADMTNHTDLKSRYLEEALMNLDVGNKMTEEHLPAMLSTLQKQVVHFINTYPTSEHIRKMRRLLMMAQSLLKK